jgi:hypothetical protein
MSRKQPRETDTSSGRDRGDNDPLKGAVKHPAKGEGGAERDPAQEADDDWQNPVAEGSGEEHDPEQEADDAWEDPVGRQV